MIELIESDDIYGRATKIGDIIMQGLAEALKDVAHVNDIRGSGCMIGIELTKPCKSLYTEALKHGLIINVTADSVVRLYPYDYDRPRGSDVVNLLAPLIRDFQ